jgi:hypothetical protein
MPRAVRYGLQAAGRLRKLGVRAFCVLYVLSQIVLGLRGLSAPGHRRFAWGMYAVASTLPTIDILYEHSKDSDVAGRFVTCCRPEVDFKSLLPPYICAKVPSAVALNVEGRIYPCHR